MMQRKRTEKGQRIVCNLAFSFPDLKVCFFFFLPMQSKGLHRGSLES
jgi:hypothetical protein